LTLAFSVWPVNKVRSFDFFTIDVAKFVVQVMSHWLINLHRVIVVSIKNKLVFLKAGVAEVIVP